MKCNQCGAKIKAKILICNKCGDTPENWGTWDIIDLAVPYFLKLYKNNFSKYDKMFKRSDNKHYMLTHITNIPLWTALNLLMFKENFQKNNSKLSMFVKDKTIMDDKSLPRFIYNQDLYHRSSCLAIFLFQTEVFLKSVSQVLKNPFEGKGYSNLVKHVLKELNLNDIKSENYNALYIPATIRNSLHEAGMYTDNDYNGKVGKILFKFKRGYPTEYVTWIHICFFIEYYFEVIDKILSVPRIKRAILSIPFEGFEMDWETEVRKIKPRKHN
ncbi:MAG: hypothetical protein K5793_09040 [Nitrosarchaeum sp.]|nr:hypothetical protein [Nitrosarchaeum sp.]